MRTTTVSLGVALIAISGFAYACSAVTADSAFLGGADSPNPSAGSTADSGATGFGPSSSKPGDLAPVDNAVIMVHAAKAQSFRLCFKNALDRLPQPDSQVMPDANVVGVEVGSAVRIGPLKGAPGDVLLFEEPLIRAYYPQFGGAGVGPSCNALLANQSLGNLAVNLGTVTTDLSKGVHLLVVRGCSANTLVRSFSVAECGATWTPTGGNLSVKEITLPGATRPSNGILPAHVVNLSQPLDSTKAGRNLVVSFGDLSKPDTDLVNVATNPALFPDSQGQDQSAQLAYPTGDDSVYASLGFRVSLVDPAGAGTSTKVLDESLASIQSQSSPRDVPPTYYAAASNYALLILGDPAAKLPDGGPDTDDRRNLHILAVPVIDPKDDAGTDSGTAPTPSDGGTATTP